MPAETNPTPDPAGKAHTHDGGPIPLAIRSVSAHLLFWSVVAGGLVLDLWSKHWAFHTLRQSGQRTLIPHLLEFQTTLNAGALFGIGRGQTGLFVVASVLALALVLYMFAHCPTRRRLTQIALGAVLAGALGNMYDRVFVRLVEYPFPTRNGTVRVHAVAEPSPDGTRVILREYPPELDGRVIELPVAAAAELEPAGYVRDFIKISKTWMGGREAWPWIFNVADMLLVGGVGVLAVRMLTERRRAERAGRGAAGARSA